MPSDSLRCSHKFLWQVAYSFQFEHFRAGVPADAVFELPSGVACEYVDPHTAAWGGPGSGMFSAQTGDDEMDLLSKFGAI